MTSRSLNPVDTIWLHADRPANLMVIECLVRLDGRLDAARFARVVQRRVVDRFPVFSQRPVAPPLPGMLPRWRDVDTFDLADHLHEVVLDGAADDAALQDYLARFLAVPLRRDRSPWEIHVIEGREEGTAIFLRLHHALADGIALARVLVSLTDETAEAPDGARDDDGRTGTRDPRPGRPGGAARAVAARVGRVATGTVLAVPVLVKLLLARTPASAVSGVPTTRKRVVWARAIGLREVKDVAASTGSTVNDVLLAALAGGLHRYQRRHGAEPADLTTMVPVNLRPLDRPLPARLGNRFAVVFLRLASGEPTPGSRLALTRRRMNRIKRSPEAAITFVLLQLVGCAGRRLGGLLVRFFADKAIGVTTNVPGPGDQRYLAGTRVDSLLGWVPGSGRQTLGTCIFTYADQVHVGFKADAEAVPDPELLLDGFHAELDALLALHGTGGVAEPVAPPAAAGAAGRVGAARAPVDRTQARAAG